MFFSPLRRSDDAASSDCQPESLGCMVADQTDGPQISSISASELHATVHPKVLTTEAIVGILGIVGILLIAIVAFFAIICGCGCGCKNIQRKRKSNREPGTRNVRGPRKAESIASSTIMTPEMKHGSSPGQTFDIERNSADNQSGDHRTPKSSVWDLRFVKLGHGVTN